MNDERWQTILGLIKDKFEVIDERTEDLPEDIGLGSVDIIEFMGPLGRMKLERTTQPLVLGKTTHGSKRIGSDTTVEYKYSDTEKTHKFKAFKYDENNDTWVEMEQERSGLFSF